MINPSRESCFMVFAADDLGRSVSVNEAIMEAYDSGLLTSSSIMAGGEAFKQAVELVREKENLALGLHVTLCDGRAVLGHEDIPDITREDGYFVGGPAVMWIGLSRKYIMKQAQKEIEAQFDALDRVGIKPCYVDSHHHLHMHPGLFELLCEIASDRGVNWIRIPKEPATSVYGLASGGRGFISYVEHAVFAALAPGNRKKARKYGLRYADFVYGLSHTCKITEEYLINLLDREVACKRPFVSEIFFHPDKETIFGMRELEALKSAAVASKLDLLGVKVIGYNAIP